MLQVDKWIDSHGIEGFNDSSELTPNDFVRTNFILCPIFLPIYDLELIF